MLDVGCGSGWFIAQMRDQGWDVTGVEPNAAAAGRAARVYHAYRRALHVA
jgi:2-polyprenyl-3-methyl-5-hydroxy-6-metoxy-1,4-benzoquinol methylase